MVVRFANSEGLDVDGTAGVLATLVSVLDEPDPDFAIATP
ncbi:alkyl sulfatase C-terminal domain-containing protein [Rhodococcus aetherivorans]